MSAWKTRGPTPFWAQDNRQSITGEPEPENARPGYYPDGCQLGHRNMGGGYVVAEEWVAEVSTESEGGEQVSEVSEHAVMVWMLAPGLPQGRPGT